MMYVLKDDNGKTRWTVIVLAASLMFAGILASLSLVDTEGAMDPTVEVQIGFDLDGGTWNGPDEITGEVSNTTGVLIFVGTLPSEAPVKDGYDFAGWRFGDSWGPNTVLLQPGQTLSDSKGYVGDQNAYEAAIFYAVWTIGKGTPDDPYRGYVEGTYNTLDGKYVESGTTVFIGTGYVNDPIYDGEDGLTFGNPYDGYSSTYGVLTGTIDGLGPFTVSYENGSSVYELLTLNILANPDNVPELSYAMDPNGGGSTWFL